MLLLKNLIEGKGLEVLKKIVNSEVSILHARLETERDPIAVHLLQGRITGIRSIYAIPYSLVKAKSKEMVRGDI